MKILDFGIAKLTDPKSAEQTATITLETGPGTVMGTAAYMSPEQARGQAVDHRSDIFSFGCVLYEMVTGTRPFQGDTMADVVGAILREDPDLDAIPSPALRRIIAHCLEKNPEQRFQSAQDIAFDLEAITHPDSGPRPVALATRPTPTRWLIGIITLVCACAVLSYLAFRPVPTKTFARLTYRRGVVHAARFTPDGDGVVYSAKWEDEPSQIFTERFDAAGSRSLGFEGSGLRSISSTGELALAQHSRFVRNAFAPAGLLARAPFSGGNPRALEENIDFAEWSPDGTELGVVRETDFGTQLEFPEGKVLYRTGGYISEPRISADGTRIAFLDHPRSNDNAGTVAVIDRSGRKKTLTARYVAEQGLAWSPKGDEVWFSAAKIGARLELRAVTLGGRERVLLSTPAPIVLQDVFKDGRALITTEEQRMKLIFRAGADQHERELSWFDWSLLANLSPDGKYVTFFESGEGAGTSPLSYLRETNGAPAVLLGKGNDPILSPDGQSVVIVQDTSIVIYPVGPGQTKTVALPGFTLAMAGLMSDGKHLWFNGNEPSNRTMGQRDLLLEATPADRAGVIPGGAILVTPDGKTYAYSVTSSSRSCS